MTNDPTILQAIASLLRSAWAILIGVLAVGIASSNFVTQGDSKWSYSY